jgi:translocation and assembly module TamB
VSESTAKPVRRAWRKYLLALLAVAVLLGLVALWYINTDSFQALVRRRIIAEVERITGGRAEIGGIHTVPFRMQVELRDVTVHGAESTKEVPLVHVDHLVAFIKVGSLLRPQLGFHQVVVEHPVIHVAFYSDGTTNIPTGQVRPTSNQTSVQASVEQIFALSINHFEMRRGELLWDDQNIPLDFAVQNAALQMDYSFIRGRYEGHLLLGKVDTKFEDYRPFAWMTTADFSLAPSYVDIKSLVLHSQGSHFVASGRVSGFRRPQVNLKYQGQVDLAEATSIARRRDLRGGRLEIKGQGTWSLSQFASTGVVAVRDLAWRAENIAFTKGDVSTDYAVDDQQIKLSKLQGKVLGGSFNGDAQLEHWLSRVFASQAADQSKQAEPAAANRVERKREKKKSEEVVTGVLHLRLRDFSAEEIANSLNSTGHRVDGVRPAGSVSGTLEARWNGAPHNADIGFALDLNPPAHPLARQLPTSGHAEGLYRAATQVLELPKFNVSTPATRIQASGTLSPSSSLRVSFSTSNLDEWRPLIAAVHGPANLPLTMDGSATFNGILGGTLSSPTLAGSLEVEDFDLLFPATAHTGEQQMHWDSFSSSIALSSRSVAFHNGVFERGVESAEVDASAVLENGRLTESSLITLHLNMQNADIQVLRALGGYNYPVTGKLDISLEVAGTKSDLRGQGRLRLIDGSAYGEPIAQLAADLRFGDGEASLDNVHLVHYDSLLTGSAAYNPSTRRFRLDLVGQNFDLARIRQIHTDRLTVEGRVDFTIKGSGTPEAPILNSSLYVHGLTLDRELAGDLKLETVTEGSKLHVSGHSQFQQGTLVLDGNVELRHGYPATMSLGMDRLDLDPLLSSYLRGRMTGHSAIAGTLDMRGPLLEPRQWTLHGNLTDIALDVEYAKVHNQDPVRFTFADQTLHIEQLRLAGEGTDLSGHGSVQFFGSHELDLTADGRIDLKLLNSIEPDLSAGGLMTVNMTVGGTASEPLPQGRLQVTNGSVAYAELPSGLSEMKGSLVFTRDRVHIDSLTARTGGGTLDLKGDATFYNRQINFDLAATGKGVRLRHPPGVSSTADAELHWVGTVNSSTLSGDITVTKLAVTPGFDFSAYLERSRQLSSITPANSRLYKVKLDIHVQTTPELQMKTAVARLSGDADLRLRGSAARPIVLGRADILEGEATFNGTKFRLERGDITFANPVAIEPRVDLQASTHVRNYDLNVTVTGTPARLTVNYRSEPPLPQSDIIALLALGRTRQESEQLQQESGQSQFSGDASSLILNQALNATATSRMQRLFGVSRIKIDPQGLTTETNPTGRGPQVTIEQEFANNLSLSYSTNVSQSAQQIIRGEYYFTRNVSVVGTRDQNGVVSFDMRIRRRKK